MYEFQLYQAEEDAFPTELTVHDIAYKINADYRNILRIFKVQQRFDVPQRARNVKTIQLFYGDEYPPDNPLLYYNAFVTRCKVPESNSEPAVMDYFFDADVVYSSVKMQYNIDLIRVDYLHWYDFIMFVQGLNEYTPLAERIRIRTMDTKGMKGEQLLKAQRAKQRVALPHIETEMEVKAQMNRFGL